MMVRSWGRMFAAPAVLTMSTFGSMRGPNSQASPVSARMRVAAVRYTSDSPMTRMGSHSDIPATCAKPTIAAKLISSPSTAHLGTPVLSPVSPSSALRSIGASCLRPT